MKLFIDTANLQDIEEALKGGFIRGITTNPSLLAKEPRGSYLEHMKKIVELIRSYESEAPGISLSVEVFTNDQKEMVKQATEFKGILNYKNLAVKIPVSYKGQSNLNVIRELASEGIIVNCTACMTSLQLMMAAAAGAKYVSLFYNRLKDAASERLGDASIHLEDYDPNQVLRETVPLLSDYPNAEIIVGSIRSAQDVREAALAGGHIITASLKILKEALMHFKTDDSVDRFLKDFTSWIQ